MWRAPKFWQKRTICGFLLLPIAGVYSALGFFRKFFAKTHHAPIPILCIGNIVVGGSGKTPLVLALAEAAILQGKKPHISVYGYGGARDKTIRVDPAIHSFTEIGDEALLAARVAPCWSGRDRVGAAMGAAKQGADFLILDDGLQNPYLYKDRSVLVIDGQYGFGNEWILPAGPLRESPRSVLPRLSAVVMIGDDVHGIAKRIPKSLPVFSARYELDGNAVKALSQNKLLAFAGTARPEKFFSSLRSAGLNLCQTRSFPDHYAYTKQDFLDLRQEAEKLNAILVTTEKDGVKIPSEFQAEITIMPARLVFCDKSALQKLMAF